MTFRKLARSFVLVASLVAIATSSGGDPWNGTPEGATGTFSGISDSSQASIVDDHIRGDRQNVRYRAEVEHIWGHEDGLNDDNGLHRIGSARCYFQSTPPTSLLDSHSTAAITDYLNTGVSDDGVAGLEDSSSNSAGLAEDDVGHARCWVDTDDWQLYFFQGEAGDNTPAVVAQGWYPVAQRSSGNLVFHGTFDAADGDGDVSSSTIPYGWTNRFTGTTGVHAYSDPVNVSEGEGIQYVHANNAAGTDSGITQELDGLKASTWYKFSVRVKPSSGDSCQLRVEGTGVTTIPSTQEAETTGTSVFETLIVWAQTDSSANPLTMILQGPDNSDQCAWKHATVVERTQEVANPGVLYYEAENTTAETCGTDYTTGPECVDIVSITVNPPGPGYLLQIKGKVQMDPTSDDVCSLELWDDTNSAQLDETVVTHSGSGSSTIGPMYVSDTLLSSPVPGTPVTYTLNAKAGVGDSCDLVGDNHIEALLIPAGR